MTTPTIPTTNMQTNMKALAERFHIFNQELLGYVERCTATEWQAITPAEGWPVGVTARHISVAHYPVIEWVQMIIEGRPLPPVTMDTVDQLNAQHAREHRACTQAEVAELLRTNSANVLAYLNRWYGDDGAQQGYLKLFDTDISAAQLFTAVLLDGAASHFASIKAAIQSRKATA